MDERIADERNTANSGDEAKLYRDLRRRNERRADLARVVRAEQRRRIERLVADTRQHRRHHAG